ncbi:MAG: NADP(H)-dependent aldo-keto reductase [Pseudomonadota bacterium]
MEYSRLGSSDLNVSKICLGTMTFGEQNSETQAHEQLDLALGCDINFLDTAEMYPVPPRKDTQGKTEQFIGSWLKKKKCRDQIIIASKVSGPGMLDYMHDGPALTGKHMEQALHKSLQRLGTDYLDLYQVHWPARRTNFFGRLGYQHVDELSTSIEVTLEALDTFVKAGKVRYIGISNETPWGVKRYLELSEKNSWPKIVSIQNPYSLLNRTYEVGLAEFSHHENIGLLAYSPLGFGMLTGKYLNNANPEGGRLTLYEHYTRYSDPQAISATVEYIKLAEKYGLKPAQMALAFVNTRSFMGANIIGATNLEQLKENIESIDVTLTNEVIEGIESIHKQFPNPSP